MAKTVGDLLRFNRSPLEQMGVSLPGPIGGYGGGTWNVDGTQATPVQQAGPSLDTTNADLADLLGLRPKKREGWQNVLGTIFDVMASVGGQKPQYWSGIADEKAQYDDFQQRMALEQYKARQRLEEQRAKAMQPPEPTSLMQNFEFLRDRYGEDFAKDYVMKPTFVQNWDGTRTQVGGGGDAPDQLPADFFGDGGAGSGQPGFR